MENYLFDLEYVESTSSLTVQDKSKFLTLGEERNLTAITYYTIQNCTATV